MLIDDFLAEYDFEETHEIQIRARRSAIYRILPEVDFPKSSIIWWLLRMRGMSPENASLREMRKSKFEILG